MAEGKRKRPRWKLPELSERGSREWDADPEGWEWKRRRTLALSKIEYLIRYGSDMVAFLASKEVTDRTDPKPKDAPVLIDQRTYTWVVPAREVVGGRGRLSSSSPRVLSGTSTSGSSDSASSSVTEGSARPTWL